MTSSVPEPDDDMADVHVQRFNEAFYRTDPAEYLLTRLQLLLLAGGKRAELEAITRVQYGNELRTFIATAVIVDLLLTSLPVYIRRTNGRD